MREGVEKKSRRLFVALDLPSNAKAALQDLCRGIPNLRWQNPDGLHVTLRFIGNVDEAVFLQLKENLKNVLPPAEAVAVKLSGVGTFSRRGKTGILWAGVEKTSGLLSLQKNVETWLSDEIGLAPEARDYTPHVTLAKPKKTPEPQIQDYVRKHEGFFWPEFEAREFALFSSHVTERGSVYTVEKIFPF